MIRPVLNRVPNPVLRRAAVVAATAAALVCTACSGSTGGAAQPVGSPAAGSSSAAAPKAAPLEAAKAGQALADAAKKASAVHVKGAMTESGGAVKLDLQLNKDSASGSVEKDGITVPVLRSGEKYYFRFSSSLVKEAGIPEGSEVAAQVTDKWVSSESQIGQGIGAAFKSFLDYRGFIDSMTGELSVSTFSGGEPADLAGTQVLRFTSTDGVAYLAASEPHYLLRIEAPQHGTIDFSGWDKPVPVNAPAPAEIYSGPGA
ncbi:hypothetical protein [Amycolatopsis jejuensis]|uniref:hypothetical protein n=1 Tax=Amycolatopsis jejuensis TaxID=330084 RepID=UPI000524B0BF|nr:hypothetical protein [Amycolatopsis jejuensis]